MTIINQSLWIELDGWQAKLRFSACHFIPNHPKCGCLHGHTYAVSVKIAGPKTDYFVMDFEDLKKIVGEICDALDHKTLLASHDANLKITVIKGGDIAVTVKTSKKRYRFPNQDVILLPIDSTSAEDLCSYLLDELCNKLDLGSIAKISVRLDEGVGQGAGCERYFQKSENARLG